MVNRGQSKPRCQGVRKDGSPCPLPAIRDGLCFAHAPSLAAERAAGRRKGGHGKAASVRAEKLLPSRLRPVLALLERSLAETYTGALSPRQGQAIAALAGAMVRVLETGFLEERVSELEHAQSNGHRVGV